MSIRRVVLDTNIIVSALLTPEGNPAKIYTMFLLEAISLVFSAKIIEEYQDVLYRPRFQFMLNKIETVLSAIRQYGAFPAHEAVQAPVRGDQACAGAQVQVIRVCQYDARAHGPQHVGRHGLYGRLGAHRHENGRLHLAAGRAEPAEPCHGAPVFFYEGPYPPQGLRSNSQASPYPD